MSNLDTAKALVAAQCQRVIDLIAEGDFAPDEWGWAPKRSELKRKMHELRLDSIRLEKLLYGKGQDNE